MFKLIKKDREKNKGIKHDPVIARTVYPEGDFNFNEVFQNAKRQRDKSYKGLDD